MEIPNVDELWLVTAIVTQQPIVGNRPITHVYSAIWEYSPEEDELLSQIRGKLSEQGDMQVLYVRKGPFTDPQDGNAECLVEDIDFFKQ